MFVWAVWSKAIGYPDASEILECFTVDAEDISEAMRKANKVLFETETYRCVARVRKIWKNESYWHDVENLKGHGEYQ